MRLLAVAAALIAAPATSQTVPSADAGPCTNLPASTSSKPANLQGTWDFAMDAGGQISRGTMALGPIDGAWGGSLTIYATNSLAIRKLTLDGAAVTMAVASLEGDVVFTGRLFGAGDMMCGTVAYHGGRIFPMIARQRPVLVYPRRR